MQKKLLSFFILISPLFLYSQKKETINRITNNSIEIEDANPDTELKIFEQNTPQKFSNAKIYGFGEASHNSKEFFDLKAKFFKYLVKNHGVKTFIMEESYQAESGINEWISGGQGDIKTIAENFNIGFWYTKEIVNLLHWMRAYNKGKSKEEQIQFYGMDIQIGKKLNQEIREFVDKANISIDENLLAVADSCANKKIDYGKEETWWQNQLPKLNELKQQILKSNLKRETYKNVLRSLNYLISYTQYASLVKEEYPKSTEYRDLKMFENVNYIVENLSKNGKAFIWAHNEHINKKEMYSTGSNIINLGRNLKDYYSDDYYAVGFDFGFGKINGLITNQKGSSWKTYDIEKPVRKTYAETLILVDKDIYFIEFDKSLEFFNEKSKHLLIGGGGYQPKSLSRILINKVYADTYDALIFVKEISVPDYNLN
ncbi:erythromycin esterase family protein [Mangrovimonas sp. AS39]|uniref:erythromycin esterase family protein n=1 Tax=Mangrovimonas futianensis TaxID=2895523 RepID=UPI001E3899D6|nr:erythromycin esterase family protein [Mangrovimonas futianensis]MCF1191194.1 erythromycin esterase family protein [Mangrovimonas futianensis]MCF1194889.1 erythromycin esterase family protein [Mangrovimonas futianensis]MCF1421435.1 erythromycin esterase family protein [Mangrovimonas futianensis]